MLGRGSLHPPPASPALSDVEAIPRTGCVFRVLDWSFMAEEQDPSETERIPDLGLPQTTLTSAFMSDCAGPLLTPDTRLISSWADRAVSYAT